MRAVSVGKIMGIQEIAMEENEKGRMFRGMSDIGGTPVVLLQEIDTEIPFTGLGIQNAGSFLNKEKLAHSNDSDYTIYAQIDNMSNNVKSLDFKGHKFKMSVNAAKTNVIRAPKAMKDIDIAAVQLEEEEAVTLEQAVRAFNGAELIEIVSDGDNIHLEIKSNVDGGSFEFQLENEPLDLNGGTDGFVHSYPVKTFINLIKNSESKTNKKGRQGVVSGRIQYINMFVFPKRM